METKSSKRVLVAVRPKDTLIVSEALGSEFDVTICHSLEEATSQLDENTGVIACGVHFDSGRMFDLLRFAKANPKTQSIPFFILLGDEKGYSQSILDGIRSAAKLLGATEFTNLPMFKAQLGEQQAFERLRQVIRQWI